MSVSLMQLPPVNRYYIRRLVQQTWDALNLPHLGSEDTDFDRSVADLLGEGAEAQNKLAELERLALLHQGLTTQGTTFRNQIMVVEQQVAELLGVQPVPVVPTVTVIRPDGKAKPQTSPQATPPAPPMRTVVQTLPLSTYIDILNELARLGQKYLGTVMIVNAWKSARPQVDWVSAVKILPSGELKAEVADFRLSADQQQQLREWGVDFVRSCSKVIRNFEQMLQAQGIKIPD